MFKANLYEFQTEHEEELLNKCMEYKEMVLYARNIQHYDAEKYAEILYFKNLVSGIIYKQTNLKEFVLNMQNINCKIRTVFLYVIYMFNRYVLKSDVWV